MRFARIISILTVVMLSLSGACAQVEKQAPVVPPAPVPQKPVNFTASGLTADPATVQLGQMTKINVLVTSTADKTGNCTVYLNVDGVDVKSQNVTLESRASRNVTFYYYSAVAGVHVLLVGECSFGLMVHVVSPDGAMAGHGM